MGNYTEDLDELLRDARSAVIELEREVAERNQKRNTEIQLAAQRPPEVQRQFDEAANGKATVVDTVATPVIVDPSELKLDLGSGPRPADGFKGVDIVDGITDFCVTLDDGERWPWEDNSVSQFRASHFIEHIKADYIRTRHGLQDAFFWFFDEAFRCAKPGATFQLLWPALKNHRAFQDPTHRRFIPGETLLYLDVKWRELNGLQHYNVRCDWVLEATSPTIPQTLAAKHPEAIQQIISTQWNQEVDTTATLRARK